MPKSSREGACAVDVAPACCEWPGLVPGRKGAEEIYTFMIPIKLKGKRSETNDSAGRHIMIATRGVEKVYTLDYGIRIIVIKNNELVYGTAHAFRLGQLQPQLPCFLHVFKPEEGISQ